MSSFLVHGGGLLIGNTLIAALLTVVGFGGTFVENLVFAQCIGWCIFALVHPTYRRVRPGPVRLILVLAAVAAGAVLGVILGQTFTGIGTVGFSEDWAVQSIFVGLFFGAIGSLLFWLRERNQALELELQQREMRRLEAEKGRVEAQLRMLQAQIEPHFLFNTLANLNGLIELNPSEAQELLDALIRYLRGSLARVRAERGTLDDELQLLAAYLEILLIRMGDRLRYRIRVDEELRGLAFPPMLLQPLVENAVRHGLEPKVEGGTIDVAAHREGDRVRIEVRDDGLGFGESPGAGTGLANVRARLASLYGADARLTVEERKSGGVLAALEIPLP
ncbi:MAG: sensor histidine kinase [Rhodocyclaceae bacterium]|nr:sensor histidine kinase [Rhodocyclaceae bacterium]